MALSSAFNDKRYETIVLNDNVLAVTYGSDKNFATKLVYDFLARVMTAQTPQTQGGAGISVVPFSQLDPETLAAMRQKLLDLKGDPPSLEPEPPKTRPRFPPVVTR